LDGFLITQSPKQSGASLTDVHARRERPLSAPYVTTRGFTTPVHKYWFYCWSLGASSERITA
jgi:hypothetical protein